MILAWKSGYADAIDTMKFGDTTGGCGKICKSRKKKKIKKKLRKLQKKLDK